MAKHTPGPWRSGEKGQRYGTVVADVPVEDRPHSPYSTPEKEVEDYGGYLIAESITPSNIPIISAATEMYDALLFARSVMISNGIVETSERLALEKIDAALAKARGEAS